MTTSLDFHTIICKKFTESEHSRFGTVTCDKIAEFVCRHFEIDLEGLRGKKRSGNYVLARRFFCRLSKDFFPDVKLKELQKIIHKDHSTVINSLRRFDDLFMYDENLKRVYENMKSFLSGEKVNVEDCPIGGDEYKRATKIMNMVCNEYGVTVDQVLAEGHSPLNITYARAMFSKLVKELTYLTSEQINTFLHRKTRDNGTVAFWDVAVYRLKEDPDFKETYQELKRSFVTGVMRERNHSRMDEPQPTIEHKKDDHYSYNSERNRYRA